MWPFSDSIRASRNIFVELEHDEMALACEICGKKPSYGNVISHAHNVRRRRWNPNLRRVRAVVKGVRKQVRVCTSCIRSGRVKKAA
jgi:large subunit ribosomal protein L28